MSDQTERMSVLLTLLFLAGYACVSAASAWFFPIPEGQFWIYAYFRLAMAGLLASACWAVYRQMRVMRTCSAPIDWRIELAIPAAFTAAALVSRFYGLANFAIWADEDHQLRQVFQIGDAISAAAQNQQAPVAYFTGFFAAKIFGINTFAVRFIPALTGALAIWPFYSWLRGMLSREAATLGAFFFLVNVLLLSLSRDGRPYMPGAFLFVICLHLWAAANRSPEKNYLWIALFSAQALMHMTLAMQPVLLLATYFLLLLSIRPLRPQPSLKKPLFTLLVAGLVAFPPNIEALSNLRYVPFCFGFKLGFLVKYVSVFYKSIGWIVWIYPALCAFAFAFRKKLLAAEKGTEAYSFLLLAVVFPLVFIFLFETILSTFMKPRYLLFFIIILLFAMAYLADKLIHRYRIALFAIIALLFAASNLTLPSQKHEEPTWLAFYQYIGKFGKSNELALVLNFIPNWSEVQSGFVGTYFYRSQIGDLSLRDFGTNKLPYVDDTLIRLRDRAGARFIYLYVTFERGNLAPILDSIQVEGLEKIISGPEAIVFRLSTKGSAPKALRAVLQKMRTKDVRLATAIGFQMLSGAVALAMHDCDAAARYLGRADSEFDETRFAQLSAIAGISCQN